MNHDKHHPTEAEEQEALMRWAEWQSGSKPELKLLFHIPNGGSRNKAEAARLKAQGVKAGVPDLFLPVPRGPYHGLWIEMKVGRNKPTKAQTEWITKLEAQGYACEVCYGWQKASIVIRSYLLLGEG